MSTRSPLARRSAALLIALAAASCSGCAEESAPRLGDYLQELEFDGPREQAAYPSLGKFSVAIAARGEEATGREAEEETWMKISFRVSAETAPENESGVRSALDEVRGDLNDEILTIIRGSSVEDLADPRLSSLKARMTEAARRLLGRNQIRQLVLSDIKTEQL